MKIVLQAESYTCSYDMEGHAYLDNPDMEGERECAPHVPVTVTVAKHIRTCDQSVLTSSIVCPQRNRSRLYSWACAKTGHDAAVQGAPRQGPIGVLHPEHAQDYGG